jgi:DNA-binding protein Fis
VIRTTGEEAARVLTSFYPMTLRQIERVQIERTLQQTNGNKSKAASILGISRQTLREKLKQFEGPDSSGSR